MTDMKLAGRVYNAQDGGRAGFTQYMVLGAKAKRLTRPWNWPCV